MSNSYSRGRKLCELAVKSENQENKSLRRDVPDVSLFDDRRDISLRNKSLSFKNEINLSRSTNNETNNMESNQKTDLLIDTDHHDHSYFAKVLNCKEGKLNTFPVTTSSSKENYHDLTTTEESHCIKPNSSSKSCSSEDFYCIIDSAETNNSNIPNLTSKPGPGGDYFSNAVNDLLNGPISSHETNTNEESHCIKPNSSSEICSAGDFFCITDSAETNFNIPNLSPKPGPAGDCFSADINDSLNGPISSHETNTNNTPSSLTIPETSDDISISYEDSSLLLIEIDDPELQNMLQPDNGVNCIEVLDNITTLEYRPNVEKKPIETSKSSCRPTLNDCQAPSCSYSNGIVEFIDNNNCADIDSCGNIENTLSEEYLKADEESTVVGRPKKGRKRKFMDQTRESKKRNVNTNQEYISVTGQVKFGKEFRDYQCNCRLKCNDNISVEQRKGFFNNYHKAGSYEARCFIIQGMVKEVPIKRKRVKNSIVKNTTREYYMSDNKVCKSFFSQTLRVSSCVVDKALKKKKTNSGIITDGRGSAGGHNRLPEAKVKEVADHILKFPKYTSHYCRSTSQSKYLAPHVTLRLMYSLYKQEYDSPVSIAMYKKVFLTEFNLRRKPLKKDTCNLCDTLAVKKQSLSGEKLEAVKVEHDFHLAEAEKSRELMNKQFKQAKDDESRKQECISFDLEKTLPLPRIPTNIVYYKRQLCFYNLGIHNSKDKGFCYTWVEGTAGRGAQEVGSALKRFISEEVSTGTEHLNLWSDSCGGQNRNIKIVLLLKSVLEEHPALHTITQHFLVPGHTFLRNDSDFSDIESALKNQQRLYSPDDYRSVIAKCRVKNPLTVKVMEKKDFFSTKDLEQSITNRKKSTEGSKVNWFKFKVIEVRKSDPMTVFVKTDLEDKTFTEIDILKKKGRRSDGNTSFFSQKLKILWPDGKAITKSKLDDLKSMFPLIPKDCLSVYKKLTGSDDTEDDIEGFGGELDFELEPV